jgi:hypothetical protein
LGDLALPLQLAPEPLLRQQPPLSVGREAHEVRSQLVLAAHRCSLQAGRQPLHLPAGHPIAQEDDQSGLVEEGLPVALQGLGLGKDAETAYVVDCRLERKGGVGIDGRSNGFQLDRKAATWQ